MQQNIIEISQVNSSALRRGDLKASFPEYYRLRDVVENGKWHLNQNVLEHVIRVFEALELILNFDKLLPEQKTLITNYLIETVGNLRRDEVLKVATLLHDIAKIDTLVKNADGTANSPGHELLGAARVKDFSSRFNLGEQDEKYVEKIVRYHGFISDILTLMLASGNKEKYLELFKSTTGEVAIELVLFMQADLRGSDLGTSDPTAFEDRMNLLSWMLSELL